MKRTQKIMSILILIAMCMTLFPVSAAYAADVEDPTAEESEEVAAAGAHEHSYTEEVTPPSCTEQGYTTYTCACGVSFVDDYVDAVGHSPEDVAEVPATEESAGTSAGKRCSVCGEILEGCEPLPKLEPTGESGQEQIPDPEDEAPTTDPSGSEEEDPSPSEEPEAPGDETEKPEVVSAESGEEPEEPEVVSAESGEEPEESDEEHDALKKLKGKMKAPAVEPNRAVDTTPPTLSSISLSATSVTAPGQITVTATASDDSSGVGEFFVAFYNGETNSELDVGLQLDSAGNYSGTLSFGEYANSGSYTIAYASLADNAGNQREYYGAGWPDGYEHSGFSKLPNSCYSLSFSVLNDKPHDTTPPTLNSISLSATSVNAPAEITFTAAASDNLSGVRYVYIEFSSSESSSPFGVYFEPDSAGILSQTYYFGEYNGGSYTIAYVHLGDNAGNTISYYGAGATVTNGCSKLPNSCYSKSFRVISSKPTDVTPPTLSSMSLSTTSVNAPGQITFTATASDDLSGVAGVEVSFYNAESNDWLNVSLFPSSESGDVLTQTLSFSSVGAPEGGDYLDSGEYVIAYAYVYDFAGNTKNYYGAGADNPYDYNKLPNNCYSLSFCLIDSVDPPAITTQPSNAAVFAGKTASFTVAAVGEGLSYKWQYYSNKDSAWYALSSSYSGYEGIDQPTLKVTASTARNGMKFRCKVTNANGTKFSNAATLTVYGKPSITEQPQSLTVPKGGTAIFTVKASGRGLSCQWQYRSSANGSWANATAEGNKTTTLKVPATAARNGYQYRCKVTNGAGSVWSSAATLTVETVDPPTITTQPSNAAVFAGKTASFTVAASGEGLSYKWQYYSAKDSAWYGLLSSYSGYEGIDQPTLKVTASAARNGMKFRCKVSNAGGTKFSNAATLTVYGKPSIAEQPQSLTVPKGGTAVFTVKASGQSLSCQWQYRSSADGSWANATAEGNKTTTLKVPATAGRNGYQYRCKVTNGAGSVWSSAATLTVLIVDPPTITTQPSSAAVFAGKTASFTVAASGEGLSYKWQYYSVKDDAWYGLGSYSGYEGVDQPTLTVSASTARDGMKYRCKVSNDGGTKFSEAATLTVYGKPSITEQPQSVTVAPGGTATFSVAVSGEGLSCQWQYRSSPDGSWANATAEGNKTTTLKVPATAGRNGYQYRCKVTNEAGSVWSSAATLTVG